MGRLTARLVTAHDPLRVDAHCFSYGPNDGAMARRQVQSLEGRFHDLENVRSSSDAAQMVSEMDLDILVDLTTHTYNGRVDIAALKPAFIVIGYLGFAGTSGCSGFDYALVDRVVVPPESAGSFDERLVYLPHSYQTNNMPLEVVPCVGDREACRLETRLISRDSLVASLQPTYNEARYYSPQTAWVCSFNANKKMEPVSFGLWMSVLLRVPSAVLVLLDVTLDAKDEISAVAGYHGVSMTRFCLSPK
jgi:protein O-GlcNAc transferase